MRALMRSVPASFPRALAAAVPESPIDVELARAQHAAYRAALEAAGASVTVLPADEACPDCCFIEDTAVVAGGVALVTRPGAPSRRPEVEAVAAALATELEVARMTEPATLDGGDCMRIGSTIYVGRSARTNAAGVARLAEVFGPRGFDVVEVALPAGVLHLKCVCAPLGGERVLLARGSLDASLFRRADIVWVPASEAYAANAVAVGAHVLVAAEYPRTHEVLAGAGFTLHPVPTSEVRKADGSLTCQSILVEPRLAQSRPSSIDDGAVT
jgi:dimethylargininase